jgi:DNA invertase Pin-like site-specific DNA recombinase
MTYGYCRCSTNESKQDIQRQVRELKRFGASDLTIYKEYESATKIHRAELEKLLNIVKENDTIVVTEISRITRSTKQLCDIIEIIKEKHLKLVIKDSITIDCSSKQIDAMTNAFLQMSAVFAELERNIISDRVKSGLQNARAKNHKLGRPRTTIEKIPHLVIKHYSLYQDNLITKTEYAKLCNISRPTLYRYLELIQSVK